MHYETRMGDMNAWKMLEEPPVNKPFLLSKLL